MFTPTAAAAGAASTTTTFTVGVSDGTASASDARTSVTATHTTNTAPVIGGFTAGQTTTDKAAASPFATATIVDPDSGRTETVTVTLSNTSTGTLPRWAAETEGGPAQPGRQAALGSRAAASIAPESGRRLGGAALASASRVEGRGGLL